MLFISFLIFGIFVSITAFTSIQITSLCSFIFIYITLFLVLIRFILSMLFISFLIFGIFVSITAFTSIHITSLRYCILLFIFLINITVIILFLTSRSINISHLTFRNTASLLNLIIIIFFFIFFLIVS